MNMKLFGVLVLVFFQSLLASFGLQFIFGTVLGMALGVVFGIVNGVIVGFISSRWIHYVPDLRY